MDVLASYFLKFSFFFSSQDNSVINAVLLTMLRFAEQMELDYETRELALECYTELLELLDFMHLPGVLLRQAECLLNLVKLRFYKLYRRHSTMEKKAGWKNEKA